MKREKSTLTAASISGMARGDFLRIDVGPSAELVKIRSISGTGPYILDVSPPTRWERLRMWLRRCWLRPTAPIRRRVRDWYYSRCCVRLCWRREVFVDAEWDSWCRQHSVCKEIRHEA